MRATCAVPTQYHPRTCAASCSDFIPKSEDAAAQVRGWYGDGRELVGGRRANRLLQGMLAEMGDF